MMTHSQRIWNTLKVKSPDMAPSVFELVDYAAPILDTIRDTFPVYTLHNHTHSENVLRLMSELLGDQIDQLSGLESALLILAAYFHDIGMAFRDEDKATLTCEAEWEAFLEKNPEALVAITETSDMDVPTHVAEWYCRWRHADRVYV